MQDRDSAKFKELWQQYSQGIIFNFRRWRGIAVAKKALEEGKSREIIIGILQFDPKYQELLNRQGIKAAFFYAESTLRAALRIREGGRWQILTLVLNSRRFLRSATIQDLNMLDTDYALLVAEQEKLAANLKRSLIKDSLQLLAVVTAIYIFTQLFIFSWHWRGIWSIYTTKVNHQTILVCRYCSIDYNSIILVKEPNLTLKQVIGLPPDPDRLFRLAVKDYPNNPFSSNSPSVISGETLQGRVLFFPSSIWGVRKITPDYN